MKTADADRRFLETGREDMRKRVLSLVLAAVMLLGLCPGGACRLLAQPARKLHERCRVAARLP